MSDAVTRILAYVMIGLGIGILCKAAGVTDPRVIVAICVASGCVIELVFQYVRSRIDDASN